MRKWFTADNHFGHFNIIKYCKRPFKSLDEMNNIMIRKWNERVDPNDTVFHLGDLCFKGGIEGGKLPAKKYLEELNGNKIFIRGNHDNNNSNKTNIENISIFIGGFKILLMHKPLDIFRFREYINYHDFVFCGHVHEIWEIKLPEEYSHEKESNTIPLINVGVDVWDFMPISFEDIFRRYQKKIRKN